MKRFICIVAGHDPEEVDVMAMECRRCGATVDPYGFAYGFVSSIGFRIHVFCLRRHALRSWLRCRFCRRWFGRHGRDCIPF